ncbi:unnamed protein product [Acanthoscelides obtectus]|uniref:Uncharacterized protein n=1 Tax=Acanthoscelides obtectus TaxID=200917 RepID=A0A9P0PR07_ACAOB|nr:unnamed protein product [Acanthoscelides obtectus]CAK1650112.1 hypothetical protein AOBTE_LOCUS16604 [Acanthoscelides obtectus]
MLGARRYFVPPFEAIPPRGFIRKSPDECALVSFRARDAVGFRPIATPVRRAAVASSTKGRQLRCYRAPISEHARQTVKVSFVDRVFDSFFPVISTNKNKNSSDHA